MTPTPLECWKALKRVSEAWKTGTHAPMQMIVDYIELKILKRFSAEALELAEERRTALEQVFGEVKAHGHACGDYIEASPNGVDHWCRVCEAIAKFDALTPTKKNSGVDTSVEAPRTDSKLGIHGL